MIRLQGGDATTGVTTRRRGSAERVRRKRGRSPRGQGDATIPASTEGHTVTIRARGRHGTIKAKDPKNLEALKVGDMGASVCPGLAVTLDKPKVGGWFAHRDERQPSAKGFLK